MSAKPKVSIQSQIPCKRGKREILEEKEKLKSWLGLSSSESADCGCWSSVTFLLLPFSPLSSSFSEVTRCFLTASFSPLQAMSDTNELKERLCVCFLLLVAVGFCLLFSFDLKKEQHISSMIKRHGNLRCAYSCSVSESQEMASGLEDTADDGISPISFITWKLVIEIPFVKLAQVIGF